MQTTLPVLSVTLTIIQLLPALKVNNYHVHRKCRQSLFYYTETLFTIMLDAINTYLCVFILCFHKLHICVFNFRSKL